MEQIEIKKNIIDPYITNELRNAILWQDRWHIITRMIDLLEQIMLVISSVFIFAASYWKIPPLSFAACAINILVIALKRFSEYTSREEKECHIVLNSFLKYVGAVPVPDLIANDEDKK